VLQKATELGVDRLELALCARSVSQPEGERKLERWREIVRQAARQCGRQHLPELASPAPLGVALRRAAHVEARLVAHPEGEPLAAIEEQLAATSREVAVAVGPEGGFTPAELDDARACGFSPVALGPCILRTETAALTALALVAYLTGRLGAPPAVD
jgi:16S rRNA (uracil1498-N3)-methyltransferase